MKRLLVDKDFEKRQICDLWRMQRLRQSTGVVRKFTVLWLPYPHDTPLAYVSLALKPPSFFYEYLSLQSLHS